jgi:hypothetical protein
MSDTAEWDRWLADADSVNALAPDEYNDDAALARVKALRQRLIDVLVTYEITAAGPELYQDSTGLAHYRVTAKGDKRPFADALAWIVLSHFGDLATVKDCHDPDLLTKIRRVLEDFGLKYVPYDYAARKAYEGKCKGLVGFSWANRYFSLATRFSGGG